MKKSTLIIPVLIASVWACESKQEQAVESKPAEYTIEQFMDVKNIGGSSFSSDESKILISSQESGIFNAYEIDVATGSQSQVTNSTDDAIFARSYVPNETSIIYTSDKGGNEITHIYVQKTNGDVIDMIADSTAKASYYGWNNDRTILYYASNQRDKNYFDLYKVDFGKSNTEDGVFASTRVYENTKGFNPGAVSNNSRYIALTETITTNNSNMYLLDTETGETKLISEHEGDVQFSPQYFSLDDSKLYYLTDEDNEFMYIKSYDVATGESEVVQKEDWDVMYTYLSKTGKYRVVGINNDAKTEIKMYNGDDLVQLANLPEGDITSVNISDSEELMTFYVSSSKSPRNLFLYNFTTNEVKQLTDTMNPDINPDDLVAGEVIRYKSFDGMEIPALLYKPKGITAGEKVPVMLMIHGGPGGQTRLNYTPRLQYFVNHGYAILAVKNRGSSGYGKTFFAADDLRHGQDDLQDCIESKKFLATLDYVDTTKIGIMGGSYGGYMVMAALAFAPEEFAVGVNYFGVTNWLRTLKSIPPWWASFKEALYKEMGDPVADSVMLYNKSPLFHADKITKPFIVLQGSNDPRVLKVESDEIVEEARKNGVEVEYVLFDDEGHGFVKKENNITASKEVLKFLDAHLKNKIKDPS